MHVQGMGKVGRAMRAGLVAAGWDVTARASRRGPPRRCDADVVMLAVRDGRIAEEANAWLEAGAVPARGVVLHLAGALDAEVLGVLRGHCRGVGQMHPLLSFASSRVRPPLRGGFALVSGDRAAVRAAARIAKALGMIQRSGDDVNRTAYHAAAWLVAGGTVALSGAARDLLVAAGIGPSEAEGMIASLVGSVGFNVRHVGLPGALTGLVRRGDASTIRRHVAELRALAPEHLALYLASARAQVPMARRLGDVPDRVLEALRLELSNAGIVEADGEADCKRPTNGGD